MQIANAAEAAELSAARTAKGKVRTLLWGTENAPDNHVLRYSSGEEGEKWTTPRHRHPFDQVRYVLEGEYSIGPDAVLPTGWVGYFPEGVYYGPQEMSPDLGMIVLQTGGPSGLGFYSADQRARATTDLKAAGGTFEDGVYHWVDDEGRPRSRPAGDAVWERTFGPIDLPPSRYDDIILMNPAAFHWTPDPAYAGVSHKRLGTFTERDLRIGLIRIEAGASWELGTANTPEILVLTSGLVITDDDRHERLTAFGTTSDETPRQITASTTAELFYARLPTFD